MDFERLKQELNPGNDPDLVIGDTPGGASLPSSKDGWIVGVDHGFPGKDFTARQSMPRAGRGPAVTLLIDAETFCTPAQPKSSMALQALVAKTKEGHTLTIPSLEIAPSSIQAVVDDILKGGNTDPSEGMDGLQK